MEGNVEFESSQQDLDKAELDHVERMENSANDALERERRPGEQRRNVTVFYSYHGTEKDMEGLAEEFPKADIYIPEAYGSDQEVLQVFRDVSEGVKTPDQIKEELGVTDFSYAQLKMIYGSRKPITIIDVPSDHPIVRTEPAITSRRHIIEGQELIEISHGPPRTLEEILNYEKAELEDFANRQKEREEYMLSNLQPKIQELLENHQELKDKEELNILLSLSSVHTGIYHRMKRSGENVTRIFNAMSHLYNFRNEAIRRYFFGKEVDDLLAAGVFFENTFNTAFGPTMQQEIGNNAKIAEYERRIISQLNLEEIREMYNNPRRYLGDRLEATLNNKGINIPHSEQELDQYLASPTPPQNNTG